MSLIRKFAYTVFSIAILLNIYIYTYPSITPNICSWEYQKPITNPSSNLLDPLKKIPYLGDLIDQYIAPTEYKKPTIEDIKMLAFGDPQIKGNWPSTPYIKRLDTFGNDYYLGHIYKVMKKRLQPNYVAVLGDLFSSQWIGDSEFFNRTRRYVTRLYDQPDEHREYALNYMNTHDQVDWMKYLEETKAKKLNELEFGYNDVYDWNTPNYTKKFDNEPLFLNVTGNHDVGYSGDATWQHMTRYVQLFGKDNFWIEYNAGTPHAYRIVVLNSLLLEGPALQPEFIDYTWEFLYQLFERKFKGSTILLTHVPFYKEEGLCVDGPYIDYYKENAREPYKIGKLRSQNHLSHDVSQRVLNLIFNDEPGIILTGHDHEGCETYYNKNSTGQYWTASKTKDTNDVSIKEVTVRAMMGEYGGNSGLMTGHFNVGKQEWEFDFKLCPFIIQHVWWVTKVVSIISTLLLSTVYLFGL
ncbi:putative membrane protein [Wickerhamomyces ciferrii]|uniref:Membrane protein n=1 Tax=Wickerhamomyces ciferrii (strain ATCC 14091 / BCRC 22168 / CBS 111 / JCM 3599 / NBRC 0793 / NRRL Y-1031 F-60-10) TaxID=1206466 RepID=K0KPM0_WICCF|nr:uncharacterized protein BN7_2655 [Wickerhamomyces ciferrii]CCH43108.1 putative membrane protein [Wickerhamomyces ciferrii]